MTRVLSALVLLPLVVGVIWRLPAPATLVLAGVAVVLAAWELGGLSAHRGTQIPVPLATVAALAAMIAVAMPPAGALAPVLMAALVAFGAATVGWGRVNDDVLRWASGAAFAVIYLGVPIGSLAAIRVIWGPELLLVLILTVAASDTAQYYTGRAFGRRKLAPALSPGKTVEGAIGGAIAGSLALVGLGALTTAAPSWALAACGAALVAAGITGDLFESMLKRSAGVKDSSQLIPGHGGLLDRIDSYLFAGPVFYLFLLTVASPRP